MHDEDLEARGARPDDCYALLVGQVDLLTAQQNVLRIRFAREGGTEPGTLKELLEISRALPNISKEVRAWKTGDLIKAQGMPDTIEKGRALGQYLLGLDPHARRAVFAGIAEKLGLAPDVLLGATALSAA